MSGPRRRRALTGLDIKVCEPVFDEPALPAVSRDERRSALADRRR
ncbi:hypothetical protein [Nocardiopsis sp. JB363]|nr:hypothetical protein [Nocardiopsis sp. JB363]